jgi:hypothetical protein
MNSVIKDLEDRFRSAGIVDVEGGLNFVDGYFSVAIWSLEKDEWNGMSEEEQIRFVSKLLNHE